MLKRFTVLIMFICLATITNSLALGQAKGDTTTVYIAKPTGSPAWHFNPHELPGMYGDYWAFRDSSTVPIKVRVWNRWDHSVTTYDLQPNETKTHQVRAHDVEVKAFDYPSGSVELTEAHAKGTEGRGVPALTPWGILALVVFIVGSAVLVTLRKRKATVLA